MTQEVVKDVIQFSRNMKRNKQGLQLVLPVKMLLRT